MTAPDQTTLELLNHVLKNKLTGINQYFLHARMLKHSGNMRLADLEYKNSLEAMKHSDMLVEHILSIGGKPSLQELGQLFIGETPDAMMANDLKHLEQSISCIVRAISHCERNAQELSAAFLKRIQEHQNERILQLRSQLSAIHASPQTHVKDCA